jgi:hypothetical protein
MTNKVFFTDTESYTEEASKLDFEACKALSVIFKNWTEKGYKIRDIAGLIHSSVDYVKCKEVANLKRKLKEESNDT